MLSSLCKWKLFISIQLSFFRVWDFHLTEKYNFFLSLSLTWRTSHCINRRVSWIALIVMSGWCFIELCIKWTANMDMVRISIHKLIIELTTEKFSSDFSAFNFNYWTKWHLGAVCVIMLLICCSFNYIIRDEKICSAWNLSLRI